jgi:hypothetical protein
MCCTTGNLRFYSRLMKRSFLRHYNQMSCGSQPVPYVIGIGRSFAGNKAAGA